MSKIMERLLEADITDKIARDPQRSKQLSIAWKHDKHLPHDVVARLGPKPDDRALAKAWSDMLEKTLERTNYGDLSRDLKFADWLTKLYTSGTADWEDISGEGGDALGAWNALSTRGLLKPQDQDLNKFKTLKALYNRIVRVNTYSSELQRIINWVGDAWNEIQTAHDDWDWMRSSVLLGGGVTFPTIAAQASP